MTGRMTAYVELLKAQDKALKALTSKWSRRKPGGDGKRKRASKFIHPMKETK